MSTVPDFPTNIVAVAGPASATITWEIPLSDGGSALTGYTVISTPDNKLYEKIIYDYLNSKFEYGDETFKPTNPNKGSFPPETN